MCDAFDRLKWSLGGKLNLNQNMEKKVKEVLEYLSNKKNNNSGIDLNYIITGKREQVSMNARRSNFCNSDVAIGLDDKSHHYENCLIINNDQLSSMSDSINSQAEMIFELMQVIKNKNDLLNEG